MSEICTKCGLPKELCVCETIAKEGQEITVTTKKVKFGKIHTVVSGIDEKRVDIKHIKKVLATKLACGGTIKDGEIVLLGDHKNKVKQILVDNGFAPETITVK